MKHFKITFIIFLVVFLTIPNVNFAQSGFSYDTDSIHVVSAADEYVFYWYIELYNDSAVDLDLRWEIIESQIPAQWQIRVVDTDAYHPFGTDSADFILDSAATSLDKLLVHFFPNQTLGDGLVRLKVFNINAPQDSVVFTYTATGTPFQQDTTPTSINPFSVNTENHFLLFPNPASNQLSLIIPADKTGESEVLIYETSGKLLFQKSIHSSLTTIDVISELEKSGLYIIQIRSLRTHELLFEESVNVFR